MNARELEINRLYWWRAYTDCQVLVRLTGMYKDYMRLQMMCPSQEVVIRIGYGAGEVAHVKLDGTVLERAK